MFGVFDKSRLLFLTLISTHAVVTYIFIIVTE